MLYDVVEIVSADGLPSIYGFLALINAVTMFQWSVEENRERQELSFGWRHFHFSITDLYCGQHVCTKKSF